MTEIEVRELLEQAIKKSGNTVKFAADYRVDRTALSAIRLGRRAPSPQVLRALKLRKVISYEKEDDLAG